MEKAVPHCRLAVIKAMAREGRLRTTHAARAGAAALGFDFQGLVDVVLALAPGDFHKSMTTHADHRIWQDVYRPATVRGPVYLKLTVIDDVLVVSFKEL